MPALGACALGAGCFALHAIRAAASRSRVRDRRRMGPVAGPANDGADRGKGPRVLSLTAAGGVTDRAARTRSATRRPGSTFGSWAGPAGTAAHQQGPGGSPPPQGPQARRSAAAAPRGPGRWVPRWWGGGSVRRVETGNAAETGNAGGAADRGHRSPFICRGFFGTGVRAPRLIGPADRAMRPAGGPDRPHRARLPPPRGNARRGPHRPGFASLRGDGRPGPAAAAGW